MKIVAIGIGQCGCNIADELYAINNYSKTFFHRNIEILTDAFAVNTDETDLGSLRHIPKDRSHRIAIGASRTHGHGVGKINFDAATIMKESYPIIVDDVFSSRKFYESDAIVVVASGAGGTGSGGIGLLIKGLKERIEKPVYAIIVLPFAYEERAELSYAVINTATCLRTVNQYADAVFLLDNDNFGRGGMSLAKNFKIINQQMVANFFDLFCAGEEQTNSYVGSKVMDAGDIRQSLSGISTIGRGEIALASSKPWKRDHYKEASRGSVALAGAMDQAINNLCLKVNMEDARTILSLVCGPKDVITLNAMADVSNALQERSPKSITRIGDYPRRGKEISLTIILSTLTESQRMESLFTRAEHFLKKEQEINKEAELKIKEMHEKSARIPSLD
ncbi:hypothetical protein ACFLTV_01855 [Chloroflexota bacterium]